MHVTEGPVVVALADQILHATRRVYVVPFAAGGRGVEQPDVHQPPLRRRIALRKILVDRTPREALPVHDDSGLRELDALGPLVGQLAHIVGQPEPPDDAAGSIVVAAHPHHLHARLRELRHLRREEQPRRVVVPFAVEQISGDQKQARILLEAQLDQVLQSAPGSAADLLDRRAFITLEPAQRTVQVQVGRVHDLHGVAPLGPDTAGP